MKAVARAGLTPVIKSKDASAIGDRANQARIGDDDASHIRPHRMFDSSAVASHLDDKLIPAHFGPYTTCVNRFNRWRKAGIWAMLLDAISKAYDSGSLRQSMAARGAWANIRAMPGRIRQPVSSAWVYRQRNAVERFFNKLEHFRALATRYDKRDDNVLASIQLAPMRIWLRT